MKSDFMIALTQLAAERHLPREQVLEAIEAALASAFRKDSLAVDQNISVKLNPNSGDVNVYALKQAVEEVEDPQREIALKEARKIKEDVQVGEELAIEALPHQVSRIAAQTAKQVVLQRLREVERELVYQEFVERAGDVISGVVEQMDAGRAVILDLGRAQAVLPYEEQVPTERYRKGQRLKFYLVEVARTAKGPEIIVSRSHKNLLKRLFEIEVPEVYNGIVEIRAIAREAGLRSKVGVASRQEGIDPVGSCIGMRGNRIQSIVNELQGEKIDVVRWDKDPRTFMANALSPSEVIHVELDEEERAALVVVPERQLSLAIGKEGQNARLAAKLTGYRLDIKSMSEWEALRAQRHADEEEARKIEARGEEAVVEPVAVTKSEPVAPAAEPALEQPVAQATDVVTTAEPEPVSIAEAVVVEEEALPVLQEVEAAVVEEAPTPGLSPEEELAQLALEEEAEEVEEAEEAEPVDGAEQEMWKLPVTPSGTGQIRFAEDIMGDFRGKGRREKKGRRSSKAKAGGVKGRGGVPFGGRPRRGP